MFAKDSRAFQENVNLLIISYLRNGPQAGVALFDPQGSLALFGPQAGPCAERTNSSRYLPPAKPAQHRSDSEKNLRKLTAGQPKRARLRGAAGIEAGKTARTGVAKAGKTARAASAEAGKTTKTGVAKAGKTARVAGIEAGKTARSGGKGGRGVGKGGRRFVCCISRLRLIVCFKLKSMGRDPKHDYKSRCIYHITIGKAANAPLFSRISGSPDNPVIEISRIGQIIKEQILALPYLNPSLQILQYVIMPDHIHFAIFVREYLPRVLGRYIGTMKVKCGQLIRAEFPDISDIFTPDFHDRYLRPYHSLFVIINYIQKNPSRLLARRQHPDFFRKINNIELNGTLWQAYGNLQLLNNPFKTPAVMHRADSNTLRTDKIRRWRHLAENGGVLVSPFISRDEKDVRRMCEEANGKIILLTNVPFGEREKPSAHDFELCVQGRLLILAHMTPLQAGRDTFLYLNSIAESIVFNALTK